jgi:hypothetical protein
VRVVADSHALYFYLFSPGRLSEAALGRVSEVAGTAGLVASERVGVGKRARPPVLGSTTKKNLTTETSWTAPYPPAPVTT